MRGLHRLAEMAGYGLHCIKLCSYGHMSDSWCQGGRRVLCQSRLMEYTTRVFEDIWEGPTADLGTLLMRACS